MSPYWVNLLQWPGFATSLWAAWLVASKSKKSRNFGFWIFLLSNFLWVIWGLHTEGYGLVALQFGLAAMNLRGLRATD